MNYTVLAKTMPFGSKPACEICESSESEIWRKGENKTVICNECFMKDAYPKDNGEKGNGNGEGGRGSKVGSTFVGRIRKSARLKPSRYRSQGSCKTFATKGKSRRIVFKKNVS